MSEFYKLFYNTAPLNILQAPKQLLAIDSLSKYRCVKYIKKGNKKPKINV